MRAAVVIAAVLILGAIPTGKMPHLSLTVIGLFLVLIVWAALLTGVGVMIVRGRRE